MSLFDRFLGTIQGALGMFDEQGLDFHPEDCTCRHCVFVRGVRGELAAFAKAEAKAEKKRAK